LVQRHKGVGFAFPAGGTSRIRLTFHLAVEVNMASVRNSAIKQPVEADAECQNLGSHLTIPRSAVSTSQKFF
jgi:hypothetical protein